VQGSATFYLCVPNVLVACSHIFAWMFHHVLSKLLMCSTMCSDYLLTLSQFFWPKVFPFSPIVKGEATCIHIKIVVLIGLSLKNK
jgi:hypothetical protein